MKGSKGFAIGFTIFILLLFAVQLNMPGRFSWEPTFANKDRNPFGCYVFDSIMAQSLPQGYCVTKKTLYQISTGREKRNVLIVTDKFQPDANDLKAIRRMAARGAKVMIVAGGNSTYTADSLMRDSIGAVFKGFPYFSINGLKQKIKSDMEHALDTIYWQQNDRVYGKGEYTTYSMMTESHVGNLTALSFDTLATSRTHLNPLAIRRSLGKGEVILVATPLLFTNYGVLDDNTTGYVFRLMSQIADRRVIRTTAYMKTAEELEAEQSPLRVFLKKPPLRTALYLALAVIALMIIFGARRRQRIIPVVEPPQNRSLEFVQLIGTLYHQKKDHSDIVRKKFGFFADELRRLLLVDVTDKTADNHTFDIIAQRTGMSRHEVADIVTDIRRVADGEMEATEYGVRLYIDNMNMIIEKIS